MVYLVLAAERLQSFAFLQLLFRQRRVAPLPPAPRLLAQLASVAAAEPSLLSDNARSPPAIKLSSKLSSLVSWNSFSRRPLFGLSIFLPLSFPQDPPPRLPEAFCSVSDTLVDASPLPSAPVPSHA